MSAKQAQEVYAYLQANNMLSSDKAIKQMDKHPQMIWEIIVKLCSKLKNKNIQSTYAQMVYILAEPKNHERSSKWLKDYMDIKEIALKVDMNYTIMDFYRPEKDKIIVLLWKIIEVSKSVQAIKTSMDELIVKEDLTSKQLTKYKALEQSSRFNLSDITERKNTQRIKYIEKIQICEEITEKINFKRQQKLTLFAKQKCLKQQLSRNEKIMEDLRFQSQDKQLKIELLKKEVSQNAPEVKKEMTAIENQYEKFKQSSNQQRNLCKQRHKKIINGLNIRKQYEEHLVNLANVLIQIFTALDQTRARITKLKQGNQTYRQKKAFQNKTATENKDQMHTAELEMTNLKVFIAYVKSLHQKLQAIYRELTAEITECKIEIEKIGERKEKINEQRKKICQELDEINSSYRKEISIIEQNMQNWMEKIMIKVVDLYKPIKDMNFDSLKDQGESIEC